MYLKFLKAGRSGIDYGTPYEVVKCCDGLLAGFMKIIDEFGRPYFIHVRNAYSSFVFCDKEGKELETK